MAQNHLVNHILSDFGFPVLCTFKTVCVCLIVHQCLIDFLLTVDDEWAVLNDLQEN